MQADWLSDTTPEAQDVYFEIMRRMSPGEKLQRVFEMVEMAQAMAETQVRRQYPEADEREVFLRVVSRWLSRKQRIAAYGWDPEAHP